MKYYIILFLAFYCSCVNAPNPSEKSRNSIYDKAIAFRNDRNTDSSFLYFNKAKDIFLQAKDSLGAGKCLVNMAIISTNQGDYFGGQELSLSATPFFNSKNQNHHVYIKSNLNNLGIACYSLKQFEESIGFYEESLKYTKDSADVLVIKNNIANVYRRKNDYKTAISLYQEILAKENNPVNYARVLSNLAYAKWIYQKEFNPIKNFNEALNIREKENDFLGQNSSYSQITDYYLENNPDSALLYAGKMYQTANQLQLPDDRLEALQKLIQLSPAESTQKYFNLYRQLADSLQNARNAAKNQFAFIRYETEKHKADNLKLQKENTERKFWIGGLMLFIVLASMGAFLWYRKRKERLQLENENAIKESELKTSKKVHDVVANGLYRIMSEIENGEELNQNILLDNMEALYEQSRDISYESSKPQQIKFDQEIKRLLSAFGTKHLKVLILGNTVEFWDKTNEKLRYELKHILQELMVNMKKHSEASYVAIRFEHLPHEIKIYYSDNGIGIPKDIVFGNGLKNTGNRIKELAGNLNFGIGEDGGLKIQLSLPIS